MKAAAAHMVDNSVEFAVELWDEPGIVLKRVEHAATLAAALSAQAATFPSSSSVSDGSPL